MTGESHHPMKKGVIRNAYTGPRSACSVCYADGTATNTTEGIVTFTCPNHHPEWTRTTAESKANALFLSKYHAGTQPNT